MTGVNVNPARSLLTLSSGFPIEVEGDAAV